MSADDLNDKRCQFVLSLVLRRQKSPGCSGARHPDVVANSESTMATVEHQTEQADFNVAAAFTACPVSQNSLLSARSLRSAH